MDIYTYLIADHRKVAGLIDDLLAINLQHVQQTLFEQIKAELSAHATAEEQTFYKAISDASHDVHVEKDVDHAEHEHDDIRNLLDRLSEEAMASPKWMLLFGELKHAVEHHVEEEETEVFSEAKRVLSAEKAEQLAVEMAALKEQLLPTVAPVA